MLNKKRKGFTLIELLVVIAIIALLSAVVLSTLSTARMKGRDARRIADLAQIQTALELYFDATNFYPPLPVSGIKTDYSNTGGAVPFNTGVTESMATIHFNASTASISMRSLAIAPHGLLLEPR